MNTYELEVRAICPHNKELIDVYDVTIQTNEIIKAETILEWFTRYSTRQVYQEDLTKESAVGLGARVTTVGIHAGVKITSIAP